MDVKTMKHLKYSVEFARRLADIQRHTSVSKTLKAGHMQQNASTLLACCWQSTIIGVLNIIMNIVHNIMYGTVPNLTHVFSSFQII